MINQYINYLLRINPNYSIDFRLIRVKHHILYISIIIRLNLPIHKIIIKLEHNYHYYYKIHSNNIYYWINNNFQCNAHIFINEYRIMSNQTIHIFISNWLFHHLIWNICLEYIHFLTNNIINCILNKINLLNNHILYNYRFLIKNLVEYLSDSNYYHINNILHNILGTHFLINKLNN